MEACYFKNPLDEFSGRLKYMF